jgi:hypothetical protein
LFKLDLTPPETFSPQALRSEREKLLKLAQSAETLPNYYREGESEDDKTAALRYEQEAKRFRLRLADMEPPRSGRYQSRGRKFTREQLSFMQSLARNLQGHFGKPYREAVGVITNIAYPQVRATSDDVRKACDARPDPAEIVRHEVALELAGKLDFE